MSGAPVASLNVTKLPTGTLVLRQEPANSFFLAGKGALVISVASLIQLLNFLVQRDFIPHELLEGILEEYHSGK